MGRVRAEAMDGRQLEALELTHDPGLCKHLIEMLALQLLERHGGRCALVQQRVGRLLPGELIVLVAVSADDAGRRNAAVQLCWNP